MRGMAWQYMLTLACLKVPYVDSWVHWAWISLITTRVNSHTYEWRTVQGWVSRKKINCLLQFLDQFGGGTQILEFCYCLPYAWYCVCPQTVHHCCINLLVEAKGQSTVDGKELRSVREKLWGCICIKNILRVINITMGATWTCNDNGCTRNE